MTSFLKKVVVVFIALGFLGAGGLLLWASSLNTPDFETLTEDNRRVAQSTKIYDRTGEILLHDLSKNVRRTIVPYNKISRHIKNAAVAIEDEKFYEHYGIRPIAILRAVLVNIGALGFEQGGSTITQQVVKNTLLTQEKTIPRKLKEWALALKIEQSLSKQEILTLYLNEAPYGGSVYGIEEASQAFFGKPANEVNLAEAAYMAALPQAPTYYSPYGNNTNELEARKNTVLGRMKDLGYISEKEYKKARDKDVEFLPREGTGIKAPHFVFYVRAYLEEKYGRNAVQYGGLKVKTTLNYDYQKTAQKIVAKHAKENTEKFNASNAGMVAVDPKTGQILAMVGSRDYFSEDIDGNFNITLAHRQPGSAFKPFVYATAFKKGYTPETVVFDLPTQFQTTCTPDGEPKHSGIDPDTCYAPVNYDGEFRGPITLRDALAQSVNIPAIKTLYLAGLPDSLATAKSFGLRSLTDINRYGLTLVLGGGEVSLLDMTSAYGVFANEGELLPHTPILEVQDKDGHTIETFLPNSERVVLKQVARSISDILSDNEARAPAFGQRSYLYFGKRDVAAKTGTTNDYRDAWIIGYTPNISVGAWAGNNDNSPMEKKVAGFIVAPMWNAFMQEVLSELPEEKFRSPAPSSDSIKPILRGVWRGGKEYEIDIISGKSATEHTPKETKQKRVVTNVHSILHWVNKEDPRGTIPNKPKNSPQYNLWEFSVQKWTGKNNIQPENPDDVIPKQKDDIHTPSNFPSVTITTPQKNTAIAKNSRANISVQTNSVFPVRRVEYFLNGGFVGSSETKPFTISFIPKNTGGAPGIATLKAVVVDSVFNKSTDSVSFVIK